MWGNTLNNDLILSFFKDFINHAYSPSGACGNWTTFQRFSVNTGLKQIKLKGEKL